MHYTPVVGEAAAALLQNMLPVLLECPACGMRGGEFWGEIPTSIHGNQSAVLHCQLAASNIRERILPAFSACSNSHTPAGVTAGGPPRAASGGDTNN